VTVSVTADGHRMSSARAQMTAMVSSAFRKVNFSRKGCTMQRNLQPGLEGEVRVWWGAPGSREEYS
jgi:hypothetical protein